MALSQRHGGGAAPPLDPPLKKKTEKRTKCLLFATFEILFNSTSKASFKPLFLNSLFNFPSKGRQKGGFKGLKEGFKGLKGFEG